MTNVHIYSFDPPPGHVCKYVDLSLQLAPEATTLLIILNHYVFDSHARHNMKCEIRLRLQLPFEVFQFLALGWLGCRDKENITLKKGHVTHSLNL